MQFISDGVYEVVTNGVQTLPIEIASHKSYPVLYSINNVIFNTDTVKTAVDNKVSLASLKGIFYNTNDDKNKFVLELNNLGTAYDVTNVYKYVLVDVKDVRNFDINVIKNNNVFLCTSVSVSVNSSSIETYKFSFGDIGINIDLFLS